MLFLEGWAVDIDLPYMHDERMEWSSTVTA